VDVLAQVRCGTASTKLPVEDIGPVRHLERQVDVLFDESTPAPVSSATLRTRAATV
jgi:hypothetical protein